MNEQRFTWKKGERLKSRKLIEQVFREGKSFSLFPFRVHFLLQPVVTGGPVIPLQAGFGAGSRHFKRAVDRNRIKRLGREAYRLQRQSLYDHLVERQWMLAVFFIYTGKELPDYEVVTQKIGVALQKLMKEAR